METGIVFIDSFTCEPFAQERVLLAVEHAYRSLAPLVPGFLGAAMLCGSDHSRVSAVVRLASEHDLMGLRALPEYRQSLADIGELTLGHDPRWYHTTAWISAPGYVDL